MNKYRYYRACIILTAILLASGSLARAEDAPASAPVPAAVEKKPFEIHQAPSSYSLVSPGLNVLRGTVVRVNDTTWEFNRNQSSVFIGNFLYQCEASGFVVGKRRFLEKIEISFWLCPAILGYGYKNITPESLPNPHATLSTENRRGPYLTEGGWTFLTIKKIAVASLASEGIRSYIVPLENILLQGENGPHIFAYDFPEPLPIPADDFYASISLEVLPGIDIPNIVHLRFAEHVKDEWALPSDDTQNLVFQFFDVVTLEPFSQKRILFKEKPSDKEIEMLADGNGLVKIPRTLFAQETDTIRITARDDTQEKEVSLDKDTSGVRVVYFEKKPPALSAEILHARLQKQPAPEVVVDAVVHNDSENEVRSVEVTLFDAATKTPYDMETIEHLPGTSDKNIRLRVPFSKVNTDNNKVSLLLVVDPHNYNNEVDTLDNIAAYTASLAADLAIEPGSIKTVPEYVRAGEAVKVQFDIYNNSDIPIQDSTVAAIGITGEAGNTILREFMVPPLAENETKHVVSPSFVLEKSGGHKLFIGLNNSDKLSESNKLNNTSFFSVTASEKLLPDFEVNADSIELVPADCVLGRPNKIYLRLKNSGPADGTATVTMYIDKTKMTEEAVAIHKKEELVLSPKLWFPSAKGPVEIGLFVDENNEKEEANKYNNAVIKTFEVRDFTYPATLGKILDTAIYPENVIAEDASSAAAYLDLSKTSYAQWNFSGGKIALSKSPEKLTVHLVPFLFDNNVSPSTVTGTFELVEEGDDAKSEIIAENVTITSDEPVTLSLADKKIEPTKNMSIKILFKNENGNKTFFASTKNLFITLD